MSNVVVTLVMLMFLVDIAFLTPLYTKKKYDHSTRVSKLIVKGICIGIPFVVLLTGSIVAIIGCSLSGGVYEGRFSVASLPAWFLILLTIGMLFCGFGDIVLEIKFIRGGVLFFLGHFVYSLSMLLYIISLVKAGGDSNFVVTTLIYIILATIGTFLTIDKLAPKYRKPLIAYNLVISASFALGATLIEMGGIVNIILGIGACFLVISDWLLARNKLVGSNFKRSLVSLLFYFGGQILIASTVMF